MGISVGFDAAGHIRRFPIVEEVTEADGAM
jgi:hypothetical protein